MTALTFVPAATGGWIAVASGSDLVLLEPAAAGRVDRVWETLATAGAFERVIRLVTEDGFSALPQFALVEWIGDHVRAVVRGGVTLEVDDTEGSHRQDGRGVSTWTERGFDGVSAVRLVVAGATPLEGVSALPLSEGAAVVASCSLVADADLDDRTVVVERSRRGQTARAQPDSVTDTPDAAPEPAPAPAREPAPEPAPVPEPTPAPVTEQGPTQPQDPAPDDASESTVSGVTLSHPIPAAAGAADPGDEGDDALSGDTVFVPRTRAVPASAPTGSVAPAPIPPVTAPAAAEPDLVGDHDGMTVVSSAIPKGRPPRPQGPSDKPAPPPAMLIVLPDGRREPLDQPIVIGRAPSANQVSGDKLPRLVTVGGSDQDISRTHVRFALEGDSVVVTDLHSRNGTLVVLPGKPPQKLRAGEPTTVVPGTVVDLGGGVTFAVSDAGNGG